MQRVEQGDPIPAETEEVDASSEFQFFIHPFDKLISKTLKQTCTCPTFGMVLATDKLSNHVFIKSIVAKKSASKLISSLPATRNKIQGAYIVEINGDHIFTQDEATASLSRLCDHQGSDSFTITFASERKLCAKAVCTSANEYCLLALATKWT